MKINTEQEGLLRLYLPHTAKILQHLWNIETTPSRGVSITDVHEWYEYSHVAYDMQPKSRASVRDSLKELRLDGVVDFYMKSDKGGMKKMYYQMQSPQMFGEETKKKLSDAVEGVFIGPWWQV